MGSTRPAQFPPFGYTYKIILTFLNISAYFLPSHLKSAHTVLQAIISCAITPSQNSRILPISLEATCPISRPLNEMSRLTLTFLLVLILSVLSTVVVASDARPLDPSNDGRVVTLINKASNTVLDVESSTRQTYWNRARTLRGFHYQPQGPWPRQEWKLKLLDREENRWLVTCIWEGSEFSTFTFDDQWKMGADESDSVSGDPEWGE